MGPRRYGQFCPIARALDLLGERWTLLIARELLVGPQRYSDLLASRRGDADEVLLVEVDGPPDQVAVVAALFAPAPVAA